VQSSARKGVGLEPWELIGDGRAPLNQRGAPRGASFAGDSTVPRVKNGLDADCGLQTTAL